MIKYFVMDVDGTLTDGKIYIGNDGEKFKAFNIKDGYGITHILKAAGIEPVIITGRTSTIVEKRCRELGIEKFFQGQIEKMEILRTVLGDNGLEACAYIGDDIPDLICMKQVKMAGGKIGCPLDAISPIKNICDYISPNKAGEGAVRDFIDWLVEE
ncbi:MAG: 3-deoxy-D-manno-octulosonate 8-phosphate phosphatase [Dorea sp.]|jgi:3-deoxy-D-manno-octulosonate 8-phosphate phosphatase (KDO 8-P phosphatase)|nr:3-deoxy-D-manno-octulosonate 8-phosphate phosphatase [Dorea sp.]